MSSERTAFDSFEMQSKTSNPLEFNVRSKSGFSRAKSRVIFNSATGNQNSNGNGEANTIPFISKTFHILHSLRLLPYNWDVERRILEPRLKTWQRLYWILSILGLSWFNLAFVTGQLIRAFYNLTEDQIGNVNSGSGGETSASSGGPNYGELNIQMFLFILSALYAVFQFNLYTRTTEVADFYAQMEAFRRTLADEGKLRRKDFLVVHLVTMMIVVCNLGQAVAAIIFPHRAQFIYSIVPPAFQSPLTHALFLLYNCHLTCSSISTSLILVFGVFLYIETMNNAMSSSIGLGFGKKVCSTTEQSGKRLQNPFSELLTYRIWQLLSNRFNDCFARITVPAIIWCLVSTGVTCGFGTIRFVGKLSFFEYAILPPPVLCVLIFLIYLIVPAAKIQEYSRLKIWTWLVTCCRSSSSSPSSLSSSSASASSIPRYAGTGYSLRVKRTRVCIRSCWQIDIRVVNWFSITKTTFISLASYIVYQTISLLLYQ